MVEHTTGANSRVGYTNSNEADCTRDGGIRPTVRFAGGSKVRREKKVSVVVAGRDVLILRCIRDTPMAEFQVCGFS